ncbi:MAG: glycosyltransferase, partial [Desulfovermiculus sp.]
HLPDKVQVVIVGDGPLRTKLQDLVVELGLKDKVVLPGRLADDELQSLMAHCSVFCLPSIDRTEAFGLVLLEAMYYARPLVSTRVRGSGMQLVNEHGVTGLCVDSGDESSLAGALDFLLHNPNLAQSMGRVGKKKVETEFHITRLVQDLTRLYASL